MVESYDVQKDSSILIVDDDVSQRMILRQIFETQGFKKIEEAENGREALSKTYELDPDLVLLDMNMPVMDGFEYCKTIRKDQKYKHLTILAQTGLVDAQEKALIFMAGANDYVSKPIDPYEMTARSLTHLENALHLKQIEIFTNRIKEELETARNLELALLPSEKELAEINKKFNIEIYSHFQTSSEMGGDFWGVRELEKNIIAIYIIDFSGHGVSSALNALRIHALISSHKDSSAKDPAKFLTWLNKNLYKMLPTNQYATMFYGVIDYKKDKLIYTSAAHPSSVLIRTTPKQSFKFLESAGFPLGVNEKANYINYEEDFNKNDILLLYSDALIETPNYTSKNCIDEKLLKDMLKEAIEVGDKAKDGKKLFNHFIALFNKGYSKNLQDDLTINMLLRG